MLNKKKIDKKKLHNKDRINQKMYSNKYNNKIKTN